ncbi:uridylate-specific endoribonuclease-like [Liolophura sinensis]|uniref:uridylate-specific endoribonuclease-like n=1 Tax=Liolophura sinensis TaxID=3198878 RepID=UPI003159320E
MWLLTLTVILSGLLWTAHADSCAGRCGSGVDSSKNCQCNSHCERFGDCCSDYDSLCNGAPSPPGSTPTDLHGIASLIWEKDVNRASSSHITVNYQGHTSTSSGGVDKATHPYFTHVNEAVLFSRPTYSHFISLLDNYDHSVDATEYLSEHQWHETDRFLDVALDTDVMRETEKFLRSKGLVSGGSSAFRSKLHSLWFELYKRSSNGKISSSGFEHVFVGETKSNSVTGFHNWIQFYLEEKRGRLDYKGYVSRSQPDLIGSQFSWHQGLLKSKGTFFVGTSPEFEMAIYTICFLMKPNDSCHIRLNGHSVSIKTYDNSNWSGKQIATAYPM